VGLQAVGQAALGPGIRLVLLRQHAAILGRDEQGGGVLRGGGGDGGGVEGSRATGSWYWTAAQDCVSRQQIAGEGILWRESNTRRGCGGVGVEKNSFKFFGRVIFPLFNILLLIILFPQNIFWGKINTYKK